MNENERRINLDAPNLKDNELSLTRQRIVDLTYLIGLLRGFAYSVMDELTESENLIWDDINDRVNKLFYAGDK